VHLVDDKEDTMALKIVEEVTEWDVPYRQPNHVYLMSGDRALAYSRWGKDQPEYFSQPQRIDRRGRKFIDVKNNPWKFDLTVRTEPVEQPKGQVWRVSGSKGNEYVVSLDGGRWSCTCPGHGFRGRCRHVDELSASVQPQE
jgi:hypothetical protein